MKRWCASLFLVLASVVAAAPAGGVQGQQTYLGYAYIDGKVLGGTNGRVQIRVDGWSNEQTRSHALRTLLQSGARAIAEELRQSAPLGEVRIGERTSYPIVFAHEFTHGEQRRIVVLTAAAIRDFDASEPAQEADAGVGFIELRFAADGSGRGVIVSGPELVADTADVTLSIENYGAARVHLVNVYQP